MLPCPAGEVLERLLADRLDGYEEDSVSAHVQQCSQCQQALERLTEDQPSQNNSASSVLPNFAGASKTSLEPDVAFIDHLKQSLLPLTGSACEAAYALAFSSRSRPLGSDSAAAEPLPVIPGYEILEVLGRGGMGVVYRARQLTLGRQVALKMIQAGAASQHAARLRAEASALARLQHPNIVQIHEVGEHDGRPFLLLELIDGGTLRQRCGKPQAPHAAADLVRVLANAIHCAHQQGITHRDLKPANVLLNREGVPKITDFGLARLDAHSGGVENDQSGASPEALTTTGQFLGTPDYMAPEQADRRLGPVGPAADVYALGVILYELLTGRPPFDGPTALAVIRRLLGEEALPPSRLQPGVPRDLATICLKCLEKEPHKRYTSAFDLGEDLRRFLAGEAIRARRVGVAGLMMRWSRRRPLVAALLALLLCTFLAGFAGVTWKWLEADEQRNLANANARQAEAEKQATLFQTYRARLAAAGAALQYHDVADAARQLELAPKELRGWEWRQFQSRLDDSSEVIPLPAAWAAFLIAAPDRLRVAASTNDGLRILDLEGGASRTLPTGRKRGDYVYPTPTRRGLRVVAWASPKSFNLLDESGRALCQVEVPGQQEPGLVVVSSDAARLVCQWNEGKWWRLALFDAASGKQTAVCAGHLDGICTFAFSPDATRLVSSGEDRMVRLWDPATGALVATCKGHESKVLNAAFSPDGRRLVTTSSDGTVRQWDAATGREIEPPYDRHSGQVTTAEYSPDGQWIASAGSDRTIRVWRAIGRQDVAILHGHTGGVSGLAFAPGGRLASISSHSTIVTPDDTVRVWDVNPEASLPVLRAHTQFVYPVSFSPDGCWLASGSWDTNVFLWDAATGEVCATLRHPGYVRALAYGPDGSWLATGCDADEQLRVWDAATARLRKKIQGPAGILTSLSVSPDGARVATTNDIPIDTHTVHVLELESGRQLYSAKGCSSLGFSPDGRWLAVLAEDGKTVHVLDARTFAKVAEFNGHDKFVYKAAFSPDGRRLATCSRDCTVRVWEIDGGACQMLRGHTDEVFGVAFHPDGTRLATGGKDQVVLLWDLQRGEEVARLQGHSSYIWSLAFSPDGATLASGSGDWTVRLWDTAPLKNRYQARREAEAIRTEAARLVRRLFAELRDPSLVVSRLREDGSLNASSRHEALREVLRQGSP